MPRLEVRQDFRLAVVWAPLNQLRCCSNSSMVIPRLQKALLGAYEIRPRLDRSTAVEETDDEMGRYDYCREWGCVLE